MSNTETLIGADPDARLDTGMKVSEAIERTREWWEKDGRGQMKTYANSQAAISADPDDPNYMPSGILNGLKWDVLDKREKLRLIKFWHHFKVRMPDVIGTPEHEYKFGQGETIQ